MKELSRAEAGKWYILKSVEQVMDALPEEEFQEAFAGFVDVLLQFSDTAEGEQKLGKLRLLWSSPGLLQ